jgi:murein DD-endopeptidase MepM/ murein hydrolase activator NlpD
MLLNPLKGAILKKWPEGHIYQFYGENPALYLAAVGVNGHNGIDMATFEGDPVRASHDGTVSEAFDAPTGYGKHVKLISPQLPDGTYYETIYSHMNHILVGVGQQVHVGHVLGDEGNTGFVISGGNAYWGNAPSGKGVHLHFGVRIFANGSQIYYPQLDKSFSILNYNNGRFGYIDPFTIGFSDAILDDMLLLKSTNANDKKRWAVIDGKRYWISNPSSILAIKAQESDFKADDIKKYPYGAQVAFLDADDPMLDG